MPCRATPQTVMDCLGHKELAAALANLIESADLPVNILVYGNWGTGKTSFINNLHDYLEAERPDKFHLVRFNPWAYESNSNLLLPLLKAIYDSMPPGLQQDREVKKLACACFRAALDVGVRAASRALSGGTAGIKLQDLENALKKSEDIIEQFRDEVGLCRAEFRNLLDKTVSQRDRHAMVVMLDDLDRCLPDNVIALIEGVKLYLSEQAGMPVVFLWAMDRDIVTESIGVKYNLASFTGRDYLEKIFDFQVPVPHLDDEAIRGLLEGLFKRSDEQKQDGLRALLGNDPVAFLARELDVLPLRNPRTLNRVWSMLIILASAHGRFMRDAGTLRDFEESAFGKRLVLGLIIAYSFREWRFAVLHNKDSWQDFLQKCKGERPDSAKYLKENEGLCHILGLKLESEYQPGSRLMVLKSQMEKLYEMSFLLQKYAC